jgi:hypothetical protein
MAESFGQLLGGTRLIGALRGDKDERIVAAPIR